MSNDPYAEPEPVRVDRTEAAVGETFTAAARVVFGAWERLRPAYNLCLITVTVLTSGIHGFSMMATTEYWTVMLPVIGVTNVAFLVGPLVETYVRWMGHRGTSLRWGLYVAGLFLASALVILAVAAVVTML